MRLEFRQNFIENFKKNFGEIEMGGKWKIMSHTKIMLQDEDDYNRSI